MTAEEALIHFLSKALKRRWQARYASIIRTKKGKATFLKGLYHQLEDQLDPDKAVDDLPQEAWASPAYSFSQRDGFGGDEQSLTAALDAAGDGSLIIDKTGRYGIHRPEDRYDDIKYYRV